MAKILLLLLPLVSGKLIGAGVLPHGDFAYDPSLVNNTGRRVSKGTPMCAAGGRNKDLAIGARLVENR